MSYVLARPSGRFEIRESHSTPSGPRGRTLATFRTLTPEILEQARTRSSGPLDSATLRRAALRVGAPVAPSDGEKAAGELLGELDAGRRPRRIIARLLLDRLAGGEQPISDSARAAARWVAATPKRHGESLHDLLLLSDSLPPRRPAPTRRFPPLRSAPP
jgi:hypothetical protein